MICCMLACIKSSLLQRMWRPANSEIFSCVSSGKDREAVKSSWAGSAPWLIETGACVSSGKDREAGGSSWAGRAPWLIL